MTVANEHLGGHFLVTTNDTFSVTVQNPKRPEQTDLQKSAVPRWTAAAV